MLNEKTRIAVLAAIIIAGTSSTAFAQSETTAGQPVVTAEARETDDDGFDLGWLGLLGLLGLGGLARRKDHTVHHSTTGSMGTTGTTGTTRL